MTEQDVKNLKGKMRTASLNAAQIDLLADAVLFALENGYFDDSSQEDMLQFDLACQEP